MIYKIKNNAICLIQCSFLAFFFIAGCTHHYSISSRYEISSYKPDGFAVSKNVIIVADNQLNYLYGDPIWMRSELIDKFVKVAIRPVQQDLFGQYVLKWVLDYYGNNYPVIHLGDANNMACVGEYKAFLNIMSTMYTGRHPWVMAPGNHDFYLMGNTNDNNNDWCAACEGAEGPMTKDKFIYAYLEHLLKQFSDFKNQYSDSLPPSGKWRAMHDSTTFLKSVAWNIDNKEPWRSYIVQELNLSIDPSKPVSAILLDTTQFVSKPNLILPNAGLNGDIQSEQLEIIEGWLKDDPTGQKITIFMSHHPFDRLLPKAGDAVDSLRKKYRIPLYISAHTHAGQYIARGGSEGWLELNVGSIVDWPMEFRTFSIHEVRDDPEKFVFRAKLFRIPECWDRLIPPQSPQCDFSWEAKPEDPDYYLSHGDSSSLDPKKTQEDLMNCILHVYIRLFTNVPSAENNNVWPEGCSLCFLVFYKLNACHIS